jgi:hypothetical protein
MGLADRDYMQAGRTAKRRPEPAKAPLFLKIKFWIWNWLRAFRAGRSG